MIGHSSSILGIEFLDFTVAFLKVVNVAAEQLELEFVIDLGNLIDPVHFYITSYLLLLRWINI